MLNDIRHALRLLARNPGFTFVACLTLALGIGANTAIFSVVDAAIFRPLPYKSADRLVDIVSVVRRGTPDEGRFVGVMNSDRLNNLRGLSAVFEGVATYGSSRLMTPASGDPDESRWIGRLSPGFVEFLGLAPQLGRSFTRDDVNGQDVTVISDDYWTRLFGRDRSVLGRTMRISGRVYTIVGVAPPTFRYLVSNVTQTDGWLPVDEGAAQQVVARLRPGLTFETAQQLLDTAAMAIPALLANETEAHNGAPTDRPVLELQHLDYRRGSDVSRALLVSLLGAVGLLLLISCSNVANLVLSRTLTRQHEIAVRAALGATRLQLVRQFVIEGILLASIGGATATVVAWWTVTAFPAMVTTRALSAALFGTYTPALNNRVLIFACAAAVLSGAICGLAPALRAMRMVASASLSSGARVVGPTSGQRRVRDGFQIAQVALTLVLLVGAGLMTTSIIRMTTTPSGFDHERLHYLTLDLPEKTHPDRAAQDGIFDELLTRVRLDPSILAATIGTTPTVGNAGSRLDLEPPASTGSSKVMLSTHQVDVDYFRTLGIPLREGRLFSREDSLNAPPVAIIDEATAHRFFPVGAAIGQRFRSGPFGVWTVVVGVVGKIKTGAFANPNSGETYTPLAQQKTATARTLLVRARPGAVVSAEQIRTIAKQVAPDFNVRAMASVEDAYAETIGPARFYLILMSLFAGIGVTTAAVGLFGVLSQAVSQRVHEIGVRMALGADASRIRRLIAKDAIRQVSFGVVLGLAGTFWLTRFIESLLYQVTPHDPVTLSLIVLFYFLVATVATLAPIRRAIRVDPVVALRAM